MKLIEGLVVMETAGETVAVPTGAAAERLHGVIRLNETGKVIFEALAEGLDADAAAKRLTEQYDVDGETARRDAAAIVDSLRKAGLIEE